MSAHPPGQVRAVALVGATGVGKTTLMEAMLAEGSGKAARSGGGVGDSTPEAKARGHSVELNIASFEFMGDRYAVIDCPGAVDFAAEGDLALPAVDLAVVVAEPDPAKAVLLQPILKELERLGVPRLIFVNKMDQAHGPLPHLLEALGGVSAAPVVAQQMPLWKGDHVSGVVDLPLERTYAYREGGGQDTVALADDVVDEEKDARFHMLEQLADFDDVLLEQLVSDETPERGLIFEDLVRELNEGLIAPVLFGDALKGYGVERLMKALRHDAGAPNSAAARLGVAGPGAYVLKTSFAGQAGKLAIARLLGASLADGGEIVLPDGERTRAGGLMSVQGGALKRIDQSQDGDVIAIGKLDHAKAGQFLAFGGQACAVACEVAPRAPVYAWAIAAKVRNDDVRLSSALAKLLEEDPALGLEQDASTHQTLLSGQSEAHLKLAIERLKRRFNVEVTSAPAATPYQETITGKVSQHSRHKKQTGGHGQFADVTVEIQPQPRGSGFAFSQRITGGVVPKQWIPAVEQGLRDAMAHGPLGFPVVDVAAALVDGSAHAVDSSEMAFRQAGRLAMEEGLRKCGSTLLEPVERLKIYVPSTATSGVTSLVSARRGQVLGFGPREGWSGWDMVEAYLPRSERHELIGELRSLSQGLGSFEFAFDHMTEVTGRLADQIVQRHASEVRAAG
jgi:elongation factor G